MADAPRRARIWRLPGWIVGGFALSAVLLAAEVLPAALSVGFVDSSSLGAITLASSLGTLVWLVALPSLLLYAATRTARPAAEVSSE